MSSPPSSPSADAPSSPSTLSKNLFQAATGSPGGSDFPANSHEAALRAQVAVADGVKEEKEPSPSADAPSSPSTPSKNLFQAATGSPGVSDFPANSHEAALRAQMAVADGVKEEKEPSAPDEEPKSPPPSPEKEESSPDSAPSTPSKNLFQAASPERTGVEGFPANSHEAALKAAASPEGEIPKKKKRKFKGLRGLLGGESRKERAARKAAERAMKAGSPESTESKGFSDSKSIGDTETVYNVDLDTVVTGETSKMTKEDTTVQGFLMSPLKKASFTIKVVLLLLDPETRRFELLQLEFDTERAVVSDVLRQIPVAVTEKVLSKIAFVGICASSGSEIPSGDLLSASCKGNEVLVGIPSGVPASECARLAKPILNDEKVYKMLTTSGIDASPWKEGYVAEETPGTSAEPTAGPSSDQDDPAVGPTSEPTDMPQMEKRTRDIEITESAAAASKKSSGILWKLFLIVVAAALGSALQLLHLHLSSPLKVGDVLAPGTWKNSCGIMSPLPNCEESSLEMGEDGVLTYYDEGEMEWELKGGVCKEDDEECVAGLEVREDGSIAIGGKLMTWVSVRKGFDGLAPFPFEESPRLKVIFARK